MKHITFDEFSQVELRAGTILRAEEFPKAKKPAFKIWADFGPEIGELQTSAQITVHYDMDELKGKKIMGCVNLGEKNIGGFMSQFLLVGMYDEAGAVTLVTPEHDVPNGAKLC